MAVDKMEIGRFFPVVIASSSIIASNYGVFESGMTGDKMQIGSVVASSSITVLEISATN